MPEYKILPAGDTALLIDFGDRVDRRLSSWVLALAARLEELALDGIVETVPTFRSLMVYYEPLALSAASLTRWIGELMEGLHVPTEGGRLWHLPVCYDNRLAPDLDEVAACFGLSPVQLIERHSAVTYHVYMLGFLPGQAYLGDLPPDLVLPRRETPRPKIPAGSLAIATTLTSIFPLETPCGWHLVGRSPVPFWQRQPVPRALLAPGDKVMFRPVSLREYESLTAQAAQGLLQVVPSDSWLGAAA